MSNNIENDTKVNFMVEYALGELKAQEERIELEKKKKEDMDPLRKMHTNPVPKRDPEFFKKICTYGDRNCKYGDECWFVHLKGIARKPCMNYDKRGGCTFGERCYFTHPKRIAYWLTPCVLVDT